MLPASRISHCVAVLVLAFAMTAAGGAKVHCATSRSLLPASCQAAGHREPERRCETSQRQMVLQRQKSKLVNRRCRTVRFAFMHAIRLSKPESGSSECLVSDILLRLHWSRLSRLPLQQCHSSPLHDPHRWIQTPLGMIHLLREGQRREEHHDDAQE